MAPEIDGKLYLTDIEVAGRVAAAGDIARVQITRTGDYDLIGRVVEILPRSESLESVASFKPAPAGSPSSLPAAGQVTRIATGSALRVLG